MAASIWTSRCDLALIAICAAAIALLSTSIALRTGKRGAWTFLALFAGGQSLAATVRLADTTILSPATIALIELLVVATSLVLLVECGRRMLQQQVKWLARPGIHLVLLGVASLGIFTGSIDGLARTIWLTLGLPGAVLTAWGLFVFSRSSNSRAKRAWLLMGALLIAWAIFAGLGMLGGAASAMAALLMALWIAVRSSGETVPVHPALLDRRWAMCFLAVTAVTIWSVTSGPATEIAQATEVVVAQHSEAWENSPYQRWKAALPILVIMALLPAVGAALYWFCSVDQSRTKLRAR